MNGAAPASLRHRDDIELVRISAAVRVGVTIRSTAKGAGRQRCPSAPWAESDVGGGPDRIAPPCRTSEVEL